MSSGTHFHFPLFDFRPAAYYAFDLPAEKNPHRVAGGLKATINNPNISEDTKQSAQERLDNMGGGETGAVSCTFTPHMNLSTCQT